MDDVSYRLYIIYLVPYGAETRSSYGRKLFLLCRADHRCRRGTFRKAEFTLGDISIGQPAAHEPQRIEQKTRILSRAIAIDVQYSIAVKLER